MKNLKLMAMLLAMCSVLTFSCGDDDDDDDISDECAELFGEVLSTGIAYGFDPTQCSPYEAALQNFIDEGCDIEGTDDDGNDISFGPDEAQEALDDLDCAG